MARNGAEYCRCQCALGLAIVLFGLQPFHEVHQTVENCSRSRERKGPETNGVTFWSVKY